MNDYVDNLFGDEPQGTRPSEDKTIYARETPKGRRDDFVIKESTSFEHDMPETTKEFVTQEPLDCNDSLSQENKFGGYCNGRRFIFSKKTCRKEYCSLCRHACPRCGKYVSKACCAKPWAGQLFCTTCRQKLAFIHFFTLGLTLFLRPFIEGKPKDEQENDVEPVIDTPPATVLRWREPGPHSTASVYGEGIEASKLSENKKTSEGDFAQKGPQRRSQIY